jgi:hypothetical protein
MVLHFDGVLIMTKTLFLFLTLISLSAEAKKPKKPKHIKKPQPVYTSEYVTEQRMHSIDLQGLQILDGGFNEFRYQVKPAERINRYTENLISGYSGDQVVSRIYELDQKSAFQNVYLYISKVTDFPGARYALDIIYVSLMYGRYSSFCSRYYITKGNTQGLVIYRYKKDSPRLIKNARGFF